MGYPAQIVVLIMFPFLTHISQLFMYLQPDILFDFQYGSGIIHNILCFGIYSTNNLPNGRVEWWLLYNYTGTLHGWWLRPSFASVQYRTASKRALTRNFVHYDDAFLLAAAAAASDSHCYQPL